MPKVFITNYNPAYDYSKADELGETIMMSSGYIPEYKLAALEATFSEYARKANITDYLLLSGSNIVSALAAAAWMRNGKAVTFLQHGRTKSTDGNMITTYIAHYADVE